MTLSPQHLKLDKIPRATTPQRLERVPGRVLKHIERVPDLEPIAHAVRFHDFGDILGAGAVRGGQVEGVVQGGVAGHECHVVGFAGLGFLHYVCEGLGKKGGRGVT